MSNAFLGEIRIWGLNFAPVQWAFCDGQLMAISQNQALYSLIGTQFGGDGRTTYGLPELRGRVPVHPGGSVGTQGARSGAENVTLTRTQLPAHTHAVAGRDADATTNKPVGHVFAKPTDATVYRAPGSLVSMKAGDVGFAGGGQSHTNMQPSLALTFTIALSGLFPQRN